MLDPANSGRIVWGWPGSAVKNGRVLSWKTAEGLTFVEWDIASIVWLSDLCIESCVRPIPRMFWTTLISCVIFQAAAYVCHMWPGSVLQWWRKLLFVTWGILSFLNWVGESSSSNISRVCDSNPMWFSKRWLKCAQGGLVPSCK